MSCNILLSPQLTPEKSGETFIDIQFSDDDLVEEVKKYALAAAVAQNPLKNKSLDPNKYGLGLFSKGKLESLLPNNQNFSIKARAAGNTQIALVYLPDLDKEKGKEKWSFFKSADEKKKDAGVKDTRSKLANEILETERTYVQGLCVAIDVFLKPILANKLLSAADVETLFGGLEPICSLNSKFLDDLQIRIAQWKPAKQMIGDLFFAFAPHFKQYASYVSSYENSAMLLVKLADNSKFQAFLVECASNPKLGGQTLQSLLITPIQRIPRYNLLLQELLKHTPATHEDYGMLHKALQLVNTSAVFINEKVREQETRTAVAKVESEFDPGQKRESLGNSERYFARRGKFKLLQASGKLQGKFKSQKEYHMLLFSDLLLIAKNQKIGKFLKEVCRFKLSSVDLLYFQLPAPGGLSLSWQEQKDSSMFMFLASEAEVLGWLSEIKLCLNKQKRIESKEATLAPEENLPGLDVTRAEVTAGSAACRLCKKSFSLLLRRQVCRACLFEICDDCSKGRQPIDANFAKKERVCDKCKHIVGAEIMLAEKTKARSDMTYTIRVNVLPFYLTGQGAVSSMHRSISMLVTPSRKSSFELPSTTNSIIISTKHSQLKDLEKQIRQKESNPSIPQFPADMVDTAGLSKWLTAVLLLSEMKNTHPLLSKQCEALIGIEEKFWGQT